MGLERSPRSFACGGVEIVMVVDRTRFMFGGDVEAKSSPNNLHLLSSTNH